MRSSDVPPKYSAPLTRGIFPPLDFLRREHQQEMLTGLRCAAGWDEEIEALRTEIAEIKLRLNRAHR
jgi:hypothetical protein